MREKIIFIIFLVILLITTKAFALSIRVNLTNATKGERLSSYPFRILDVELDKDKVKVLKTHELRTGPSGTFEGDVDVSSATAIIGEVNYRGVSYYSPIIYIKKEQEDYALNFNVYEITDKAENVEISQRTMMIIPHDDKTIVVYDTITIENNSRLTYVGKYNDKLKMNQVLFIPLPAGYSLTSIQGTDQQGIYTLSDGIVSQNKVLPGESSIFLNYFVKSDIGVFDMSLHTEDDSPRVKKITLFFKTKEGWKVKSSNLQHGGERKFEGGVYGTYHVWEGGGLKKVDLRVLAPSYQSFFSLWQASIIAAFIVIGAGLFIMKGKIYRWNLVREKKRLEGILARLKGEADEEDLRRYYMSFQKVLEDRRREIEERLRS